MELRCKNFTMAGATPTALVIGIRRIADVETQDTEVLTLVVSVWPFINRLNRLAKIHHALNPLPNATLIWNLQLQRSLQTLQIHHQRPQPKMRNLAASVWHTPVPLRNYYHFFVHFACLPAFVRPAFRLMQDAMLARVLRRLIQQGFFHQIQINNENATLHVSNILPLGNHKTSFQTDTLLERLNHCCP